MFDPLPPINVVVQNPPGMSEWAKTLLSASVGFIFAMVASVVMEYLKPWIAKGSLRTTIAAHVGEEVLINLNLLEGALKVLLEVQADKPGFQSDDVETVGKMLKDQLSTDCFDNYFGTHKELVYESKRGRELIEFNRFIKTIKISVRRKKWSSLRSLVADAVLHGRGYCNAVGTKIERWPTPIHRFFNVDVD
jgi:hypothetical protein